MRIALLLLSVSALATGCIIYDDPAGVVVGGGGGGRINVPPSFLAVDSAIFLDADPFYDTILFRADAFDADGDPLFVSAEVFDDYTGQIVDRFDLFATPGGAFDFESEWFVRSTNLIPDFYADYSVDFVVEDQFGDLEVVTQLPEIVAYY
ncbi:MAG: hypothetical protein AAGA48_36370 [Myxococcota bacterium]